LCFAHDCFVLSDFSSASLLSGDGRLEDTQGSPAFLSPEECRGGSFDGRSADVWAFGVTLFFTSFRRFPFDIRAREETDFVQLLLSVTRCLATNALEIPTEADKELAALIRACLEMDPARRPTISEVSRSNWLQKGD
jgi:serine/threonine protein kinase